MTPGDAQPCRCSPMFTTSSTPNSAKRTSVYSGGKIVRSHVLGARAIPWDSGAHIILWFLYQGSLGAWEAWRPEGAEKPPEACCRTPPIADSVSRPHNEAHCPHFSPWPVPIDNHLISGRAGVLRMPPGAVVNRLVRYNHAQAASALAYKKRGRCSLERGEQHSTERSTGMAVFLG